MPALISERTARRVGAFLHGFLLAHALAFYAGVLELSNAHDRLTAVAGYILAHRLDRITNRDIQRGNRTMRGLGMGSLYRSKHELVFVYRVGAAPHLNMVELGKHGRNRTNVWDYASVNSMLGSRREDLALRLHAPQGPPLSR